MGALAYLSIQNLPFAIRQDQPVLSSSSPTDSVSTIDDPPIDIDLNQSVEELKSYATDSFKEQQVEPGIEAVKALLDRNALKEASEAIEEVPKQFEADPRINFLRGRLSWQGAEAKDGIHTVEQARQFWQSATEAEPEVLPYQKALAFAYYAEGNFAEVIQTWFSVQSQPAQSLDMLTIEAINALAQNQLAATQPPEKRDAYKLSAVQNYRKVVKLDPKGFTLDALAPQWLWTDAVLADWQSLAKLAGAEQATPKEQATPEAQPSSESGGSPSAQPGS